VSCRVSDPPLAGQIPVFVDVPPHFLAREAARTLGALSQAKTQTVMIGTTVQMLGQIKAERTEK
jgi:hypothetical protein